MLDETFWRLRRLVNIPKQEREKTILRFVRQFSVWQFGITFPGVWFSEFRFPMDLVLYHDFGRKDVQSPR